MKKKKESARKFLNRFVAFLLPEEVDDCLRLQALLQETGRSTLVRGIVSEHVKESKWDRGELSKRYGKLVYSQWCYRKSDTIDYDSFTRDLRKDLLKSKKLSETLTNLILEVCEEEHRNQSTTK